MTNNAAFILNQGVVFLSFMLVYLLNYSTLKMSLESFAYFEGILEDFHISSAQ